MSPRLLQPEDLRHLVLGASVLGTGGGGSFSLARAMVEDLGARGMRPKLLDPLELKPGALGISTAMLGGGLSNQELERLEQMSPEPPAVPAARALSAYLGCPIDFVFPIELGPQNTMEAVRLAAFLDVPVLDGDCAGRAVPEMHQTTLSLFDIPLTPFVLATFQGDVAILTQVSSDARSEALCRAIASASGGLVCVTGFPVKGQHLREAIIPRTLTRCMEIGSRLGPATRPAEALATLCRGRVAFQGRVQSFEVECRGSFFWGFMDLDGTGSFSGARYRVGIQNEFMWAWKDGLLDIQCPDLVCVLDSDSGVGKVTYGHGFENAIEAGDDLTVLHLPCDPVWGSERGRRQFPLPPSDPPPC